MGEDFLNPCISNTDKENKYYIQILDLSFQVDHITPKKVHSFEEYIYDPANARFFVKLVRRREIEMISFYEMK